MEKPLSVKAITISLRTLIDSEARAEIARAVRLPERYLDPSNILENPRTTLKSLEKYLG